MSRNFSIADVLAAEHSKRQTMRIVNWIGDDKKRFAELIRIFLSDNYRLAQRSSMAVNYCVQYHPELVRPHLKKMIANLSKTGLHDAVIRNTIRMLQFIEVPKSLQGQLVNACFKFLQDPESPIAVKAFSMTALYGIAKTEPDLKHEIKLVIEDMIPYGSPAIRNRGKKILAALQRIG